MEVMLHRKIAARLVPNDKILETYNKVVELLKSQYSLDLINDGYRLSYTYDTKSERTGITSLIQSLREQKIRLKDLKTEQSSLENIFVNLVRRK